MFLTGKSNKLSLSFHCVRTTNFSNVCVCVATRTSQHTRALSQMSTKQSHRLCTYGLFLSVISSPCLCFVSLVNTFQDCCVAHDCAVVPRLLTHSIQSNAHAGNFNAPFSMVAERGSRNSLLVDTNLRTWSLPLMSRRAQNSQRVTAAAFDLVRIELFGAINSKTDQFSSMQDNATNAPICKKTPYKSCVGVGFVRRPHLLVGGVHSVTTYPRGSRRAAGTAGDRRRIKRRGSWIIGVGCLIVRFHHAYVIPSFLHVVVRLLSCHRQFRL